MSVILPSSLRDAFAIADPSWQPILERGLDAVSAADASYLPALARDTYLPTDARIFAAFMQPLDAVRYVLVGEGPYPRAASATGVCFMDGAVEALWSPAGLSKPVNRATSLRNFIKMLLVADGLLDRNRTSGEAMAAISAKARAIGSPFIQTLTELQANLTRHGFLLLNASLVFREHVAPSIDGRAWLPFLSVVLDALATRVATAPTLVLWGKVAGQLKGIESAANLPKAIAEHPYNLSFISNRDMHELFGPMHLLRRSLDVKLQ